MKLIIIVVRVSWRHCSSWSIFCWRRKLFYSSHQTTDDRQTTLRKICRNRRNRVRCKKRFRLIILHTCDSSLLWMI